MEKLDSKAVWIFFFQFLGVGLVLALIFGWFVGILAEVGKFSFGWWMLIALFIILIFGSYGWAKLSYSVYRFELTDEAFRKEWGVILKRYVSIPYERIRNIEIRRGILSQILGLNELMIQTGGYSGTLYYGYSLLALLSRIEPEGWLPGLSKERAEEIRDELIRRAKGTKSGV